MFTVICLICSSTFSSFSCRWKQPGACCLNKRVFIVLSAWVVLLSAWGLSACSFIYLFCRWLLHFPEQEKNPYQWRAVISCLPLFIPYLRSWSQLSMQLQGDRAGLTCQLWALPCTWLLEAGRDVWFPLTFLTTSQSPAPLADHICLFVVLINRFYI